jgi:uncharacterized iron-regulated membrane protein
MRFLHSWLGLLFAIPVILVSLSGAVLCFAPESDQIINVELMSEPFSKHPLQSVEYLLRATKAAYPAWHLLGIAPATTPVNAAMILMSDETGRRHEVFINSQTADINGQRLLDNSFYTEIYRFHTRLSQGHWGQWVTRIATLGLLLTIISGLVFRWRKARSDTPVSSHPLIGMIVAPILLMITLTGLLFAIWPPMFGTIQQQAMQTQVNQGGLPPVESAIHALQLDAPNCSLRWLGVSTNASIQLICSTPNSFGTLGVREFFFQERTGLHELPMTTGAVRGELFYSMHTGEWLGMPGRIFWVLASMSILFLIYSGIANRYKLMGKAL